MADMFKPAIHFTHVEDVTFLALAVLSLQEVAAALTLAQQGVLLVAGVTNNRLQGALRNPLLHPLLGGVETVTTTELKRNRQTKQTRRKVKVCVRVGRARGVQACSQRSVKSVGDCASGLHGILLTAAAAVVHQVRPHRQGPAAFPLALELTSHNR
jgi:hypothetical protein